MPSLFARLFSSEISIRFSSSLSRGKLPRGRGYDLASSGLCDVDCTPPDLTKRQASPDLSIFFKCFISIFSRSIVSRRVESPPNRLHNIRLVMRLENRGCPFSSKPAPRHTGRPHKDVKRGSQHSFPYPTSRTATKTQILLSTKSLIVTRTCPWLTYDDVFIVRAT